ncbi:MAG: SecDF P1 head subdomain-containing protein [Planctomycetota bacterium]
MKRWMILACCLLIGCLLLLADGGCKRQALQPQSAKRPLPKGILEFHILVDRSLDTSQNLDELAEAFAAEGTETAPPDGIAWFEVDPTITDFDTDQLVIVPWQGRRFILTKTDLRNSLDARTTWRVVHFEKEELPPPSGWKLHFELDQAGGEQMGQLTGANLERKLGVFLFGKLSDVATIKNALAGDFMLVGHRDGIDHFHKRLVKASTSP